MSKHAQSHKNPFLRFIPKAKFISRFRPWQLFFLPCFATLSPSNTKDNLIYLIVLRSHSRYDLNDTDFCLDRRNGLIPFSMTCLKSLGIITSLKPSRIVSPFIILLNNKAEENGIVVRTFN